MRTATPTQIHVLRLLATGMVFRRIAEAMGYASTNAVNDHVQALRHKGLVYAPKGKGRSLRYAPTPTPEGLSALGLKVCPVCNGRGHVTVRSSGG